MLLRRTLTRRALLRVAGAGSLLLGGSLIGACATTARPTINATARPVADPAFMPDLDVTLRAAPAEVPILPGARTNVWTYQAQVHVGDPALVQAIPGSYLGPIIRARTGQKVRVTFENALPEPDQESIIHWHGLHLPANVDGHPSDAVKPGERYIYEFTVTDRAGTYWFHPHPHGTIGKQVIMGLAGLFLVSDAEEDAAGLPTGAQDLPVVIQDRTFDGQNQFVYEPEMMSQMMGFLGERILVNGTPDLTLDLATTRDGEELTGLNTEDWSYELGQGWVTAHVIGVTLAIGYAWASLDASRSALAGLCLGLGFATRTPMGFMFPFFLWEAVRASGGWAKLWQEKRISRELAAKLVRFAIPAAAVLALLLIHNYARFERFTEFGHKYLNISWQDRIQRWGLFNYHFLSRNLACALVLMPKILAVSPYVRVSQHGMSMFMTSPTLAYLFAPKQKSVLSMGLWLTVLAAALPSLLYQNSGYIQFGYRFSLDYMVFLMMLLAVGDRPITRLFKVLVVLGVAVNLFGAIVFDRYGQFTYEDTFFPHGNN